MTATVLVVGSGGREHAIAMALSRSPLVGTILVAPGNGGTARDFENVDVAADDLDGIVALANERDVSLTVVGPEAPLAAGLVDRLEAVGRKAFGPSAAAARIESSKVFAKKVMEAARVPTASWGFFSDVAAGVAWAEQYQGRVVVKADGLAAGKGVFICSDLHQVEQALRELIVFGNLGDAGRQVIVEEHLDGEEISLLCFTDGDKIEVMPAAQDHKRVGDGDEGPNTGGMGAYAPAPAGAGREQRDAELTLHRIVNTLARWEGGGIRFKGVLYAGLMMTRDGPRVLEYNCRFGDPEAQVLLPLLKNDLYEVMMACVEGRLADEDVYFHDRVAATVVAASKGYPGRYDTGHVITGIDEANRVDGATVVHAGTRSQDGALVTHGGRVLAVTGVGKTLKRAITLAYEGMGQISYEGMHYRRDIGHRALGKPMPARSAYADAGVDIDAGHEAIALMKGAVERTHDARVLGGLGAFGGQFDLGSLTESMEHPVLVASTDGVGTKTKIASAIGRYDSVGIDIVNHCIDDILVQGAEPLFFMDYVASSKLDPAMVAAIVGGAAGACEAAGCALLGGETAEMPGVYSPGEFDLVGTIVGVVEHDARIDGSHIEAGDAVIALASAGLHTNGFTLARKVLEGHDLQTPQDDLDGQTLADALLAPHRSYLAQFRAWKAAGIELKGLVHITGGGLIDNPPRVLPEGLAYELWNDELALPPLFELLRKAGSLPLGEMRRVFNCGIGLLAVIPVGQVQAAIAAQDERCWRVGSMIERGDRKPVVFR